MYIFIPSPQKYLIPEISQSPENSFTYMFLTTIGNQEKRILGQLIRSIHRAYINGMHLSLNQIERVDANVLSQAISVVSGFPLESCHIHVYSNT